MMIKSLRVAALGLAFAVALPAVAQTPPPPPQADGAMPQKRMMRHGPGAGMMMERGMAFATLSEAGRATMREALRAAADRRAEHEAVKAARDKMLAVLAADRLDTGALKRAMDEERAAANAGRERAQAAMVAAFTKLSTEDRKAFVNETRVTKARMEMRVKQWRDRRGRNGGPGGPGGPEPVAMNDDAPMLGM